MFNTIKSEVFIGKSLIKSNDFDNRAFSFKLEETESSIKGVLIAKRDIKMHSLEITTEKAFADDDLFFKNGYQSWSTTREVDKDFTFKGLIPLAYTLGGFPKYAAGIMSDYGFGDFYNKKGCFHSYTYTYFRKKGEPNITLYGSKTERKGFTLFIADMQNGAFTIKKDIEGLILKAGEEYEVFDIAIINDEYEAAFDKYFFDFVGVKEPKIKHLAGYTSWYNYFSKISEDICLRDLEGMDAKAKDCTNIFQIDDGYQTATGDWLSTDPKKFPNGMKYIADKIHEKGYLAGIWLAPFCAQLTSQVAKDHPEWMIKSEKTGKKVLAHLGWGGSYALDIYNDGARNYIKHFFDVILNDWGYDMVKLDFLFTQCYFPRGGRTRGEIMCDGIDLLREACGDKLILGCGVPLGACMGIFDACRIGCDANKVFVGDIVNKMGINNEIPSTQNSMINSIFRRHLDGRAFCNDPDVLFLRDNNLKFTEEQKLVLGKINAVCGNVLFVSDNMGDYNEKTVGYVKNFFEDKKYEVKNAEFINDTDVEIIFTEEGVEKTFIVNLYTGEGNIFDVV